MWQRNYPIPIPPFPLKGKVRISGVSIGKWNNIALGASLATVLLTLPVIEGLALITGERIEMALTPIQAGMLLLTFLAVMNNLHDGETNAIEGISHFVLFAAFIALVMMGLL